MDMITNRIIRILYVLPFTSSFLDFRLTNFLFSANNYVKTNKHVSLEINILHGC